MRKGLNPEKAAATEPYKRHRVIVPVYIPHQDGYFKHAIEILRLCLDSLYETTRDRASLTVISNGCTPAVVAVLEEYLANGRIHQLMLNARNWGKIDAALAALRGRFEELLTISDADVLFKPGWLDAIEALFREFPECGFATPSPNPSLAFTHTTSTILAAAAARELRFARVVPDQDIERFGTSIGRPEYLRPEQRRVQLLVQRNGVTACVGGGHFVFTMRREIAWRLPKRPSLAALKPLGETEWFDDPPDNAGVWRLSTDRAYAHHLGNVPEPWMYEELESATAAGSGSDAEPHDLPPLRPAHLARLPFSWRKAAANALRKLYLEREWQRAAERSTAPHATRH